MFQILVVMKELGVWQKECSPVLSWKPVLLTGLKMNPNSAKDVKLSGRTWVLMILNFHSFI